LFALTLLNCVRNVSHQHFLSLLPFQKYITNGEFQPACSDVCFQKIRLLATRLQGKKSACCIRPQQSGHSDKQRRENKVQTDV